MKKKVSELGFYDALEVKSAWLGTELRFEINYDRLPLIEICKQWQKVVNQSEKNK